jgi:molybdopterin-guanine dinucleotide biosynthesis protein A
VARRGLTGILLVGGASRRFGAPKALARFGDESLAERAWRVLGEACEERLAVGKAADRLALPFPVLDDGIATRAALAGIVAGLRVAAHDVAVVLPVDVPLVTAELVVALGDGCADAAATEAGALPAAFRKRALPTLERRLAAADLAVRDALAELSTAVVAADRSLLVNVNTPADLARLASTAST